MTLLNFSINLTELSDLLSLVKQIWLSVGDGYFLFSMVDQLYVWFAVKIDYYQNKSPRIFAF